MKRSIQIMFSIFFTTIAIGQNFPGKDVHLLLNKEIRILPKEPDLQTYGYRDFYTTNKFGGYANNSKWVYKKQTGDFSEYNSLVGKTFKVLGYEPYKTTIGKDQFKIKIENTEIGILYYDYDPAIPDFIFPFEVVGGLELPPDFYCKDIEISYDKFTGETNYETDTSLGIMFKKVEKDGKSTIYLYVRVVGETLNMGEKGVILLLENKKRIERPDEPIDVRARSDRYSNNYAYTVFMELTTEEINLLKENNITDIRLYIYDREVKNGSRFKEYLKCLTK